MQIDIEKLNRKNPYPEPSEDFFKKIQANVISQTVGEDPVVVEKEAKVFSLNFKWMAAAAVILIGGITAIFSLNDDSQIAVNQQAPIIDSVYKVERPLRQSSSELVAKNDIPTETRSEMPKSKHFKTNSNLASSDAKREYSSDGFISDRQDYAVGTNKKSDLDVEKVLAAFTPDQLKDIDRNSEQDVYLDLYN